MLHKRFRIILWNYMVLCNGAIIPVHRQGKLSLVEWTNYNYREPEGYGTYAFGYDVEDPETNNIQFRNEEKLSNGSVIGSYGYLEESGNAFVVNYIADHNGYRAFVEDSTKLKNLKPSFLTPLRQREVMNTSDYSKLRAKNEKNGEEFSNTSVVNENHAQHHRKNKEGSNIDPIHSYIEKSENEKKKMNPARKKYPDSNVNKGKEANFLYNTKSTSKIPNFHGRNDETALKEIIISSNKKKIVPRSFDYLLKNVSRDTFGISELRDEMKLQKTLSKNSDLNLISKRESTFLSRNKSQNSSFNSKTHPQYFANMPKE